jgi:16S rRNA (adenine1518-N6/adenine1519-N6)-dimethyltransferase
MNPCVEDLFDVVDENDVAVECLPRDEVHAKGLLHRACHVWITDCEGRVLLQRRSMNKDTFPNCWTSSVSGHVDAGETYEQTVLREIAEEVGLAEIKLEQLKLIAYQPACQETEQEFVKLYHLESEGPFRFPADEISELVWKTPSEITRMMQESPATFAPSLVFLWGKYLSLL